MLRGSVCCARSALDKVLDVGFFAEVFEPAFLGFAGDFAGEDVLNDAADFADGLDALFAFFLTVEDEGGFAEGDGLAVFAGLEGEGGGAEFFADVGFFDPAPVAAFAGTVVGAVFAGEVAEVASVFKGLHDLGGGGLEVGGDLPGGGGEDDLAQAHGFFLIEAEFVAEVEFLNALGADFGFGFAVLSLHDVDRDAFVNLFAVIAGGLAALFEVADEFAAVAVEVAGDDFVVFGVDVGLGDDETFVAGGFNDDDAVDAVLEDLTAHFVESFVEFLRGFRFEAEAGKDGFQFGAEFLEGNDLSFCDSGDAVAESADGKVLFLGGEGTEAAEAGGEGKEAEAMNHDGRAWRLRKV